jgi:hypothetical protein
MGAHIGAHFCHLLIQEASHVSENAVSKEIFVTKRHGAKIVTKVISVHDIGNSPDLRACAILTS